MVTCLKRVFIHSTTANSARTLARGAPPSCGGVSVDLHLGQEIGQEIGTSTLAAVVGGMLVGL